MRNIDRVQRLASSAGMRLRPHAKTHKSPVVAKWQIERGAVGVCCAKVGEAEVFVDAGIADIRLPYPVSHAGHGYHAESEAALCDVAQREAETLASLRDRAQKSGISLEEISVGATPTLRFSARQRGITELRPGNYVYFDRTQVALGAAGLDDCALTVLATVVTAHPGRIVLDSGSKTLTNDTARGITMAPGYGAVLREDGSVDESLVVERLSEEHATVRVVGETRLKPGDRVRILPNHSCTVSNLVDAVRLVEGDRVIDTLPVAARGRIT